MKSLIPSSMHKVKIDPGVLGSEWELSIHPSIRPISLKGIRAASRSTKNTCKDKAHSWLLQETQATLLRAAETRRSLENETARAEKFQAEVQTLRLQLESRTAETHALALQVEDLAVGKATATQELKGTAMKRPRTSATVDSGEKLIARKRYY